MIGNVISSIWEQVEEAKFKSLLTELRVSILRLQSFHNKYTHKLQEAYMFIQTEEGVRFALSVKDVDEVGMKPPGVKNHFWENAYNVISATLNSQEVIRVLKEIKDLVKFLKPDYYMSSSQSGLAVIVNHPRFRAHGVDSVGNLITESVKTVSAIAIIFNDILGIVFGIWDVVSGANKIKNGSQMASDLRETVKKLKALVEDQVNLDEALQQ